MQRKIAFSENEFYHVYSRGVEKRKIFLSKADYHRFVRLLYVANSTRNFVYRDVEHKKFIEIDRGEPLVAIGAWVLMPNHFHLLLKEIKEGGISLFMQKLLTGYSAYFNKRHDRVGGLFQGVFQAQHVETDEHLKYLFAYIHLNPVKLVEPKWKEEGIVDLISSRNFLERYTYSSYLDYMETPYEQNGNILSKQEFPEYFSEPKAFDTFIRDWLTFKEESSQTT